MQTAQVDVDAAKIDPYTTVDLAWRMDITDRARLTASIANVTDKEPDIVAYGLNGDNVLAQYYDVVGRRYALELEFKF